MALLCDSTFAACESLKGNIVRERETHKTHNIPNGEELAITLRKILPGELQSAEERIRAIIARFERYDIYRSRRGLSAVAM